MANSSISSLGLGSSGALSYSTIDKLRKADESVIIKPIDNKLAKNKTQSSDLSILTTMTASLKAETSTLSDEVTYLGRSATSSNTSSIGVSVQAGTEVQDFSFDVSTLAKRDIFQSKGFTNKTDTFTSANDTINFNIAGHDYGIDVTSGTTIEDFKNEIYDKTNGKITASLLNVGGTNPYRLIVKSTDTGTNNAITITSTGGGSVNAVSDLGLNTTANHIQTAGDLSATYNGVSISRSSNSINDLIVGVTLDAKSIGSANISIKQDTKSISDALSSFVTKYNDLMNNLTESTKYDTTSKASGTFQGNSDIRTLKSDISKSIFNLDKSGRSLENYGITLNSNGLLQFDSNVLNGKIQSNSADVENFFRGDTTTDGVFAKYNSMLSGYIDSRKGVLTRFNNQLIDDKKTLLDNKTKATQRLDDKYSIMAKKFAAYDSIIAKFNSSFQSLSMQISSMTNSKNG